MVTTTIHKTIGGGRGGMILCREEYAKQIDSAVFPGQQGGPLEHIIAGKAVALRIAATESFRERQERTVVGARAVAAELLRAGGGVSVLTGGTDVHLVLCDLRESSLDGQQAEDRLALDRDHRQPQRGAVRPAPAGGVQRAADRHAGAGHARPPARGLRRGGHDHRRGPRQDGFDARRAELADRAAAIAERYPLYARLGAAAIV